MTAVWSNLFYFGRNQTI